MYTLIWCELPEEDDNSPNHYKVNEVCLYNQCVGSDNIWISDDIP